MLSRSERYVISLNGEIYNHRELRRQLVSSGHAFRGNSDTEVLLAAIDQWGIVGAVTRSVGMFAFAVWDRAERRLHLVRDRLGEKPLYYGWQGDALLFASELKAMRVHPNWRGHINRDAITLLLRFNYIPAPHSIYSGIRKLLPGSIVTFDPTRPAEYPDPVAYWSAADAATHGATNLVVDESAAVDELEMLLRDSVRGQMVADVPVGAFLSGGIDSSTVVALMQAQATRPTKTFTIGFADEGYNEAADAKAVAMYLGTDHTELYVTPNEAMAVIPGLAEMYDEPFADSSQIPTHIVSRMARQSVIVALSGDGGDELFGGYNRYLSAPRIWGRVAWLPSIVRSSSASVLDSVPPVAWNQLLNGLRPILPRGAHRIRLSEKVRKIADVMRASDPHAVYEALVSVWPRPSELVLGGVEPSTILQERNKWPRLDSFVSQMMFLDQVSYLPDDILTKIDRAAMSVSLETRVPFLDHRVVEFAWRVPIEMKIRNGIGKQLLRRVLNRHVPARLFERPKMGFGVPVGQWIRGPLRPWAEELLDERRLRESGILNPTPIRELWDSHLHGRADGQFALWGVLMLQAWLSAEAGAIPIAV